MKRKLGTLAAAIAMLTAAPVLAQKSGGILKVHHQDSPASMSIIEEATYSTVVPMMGVFNNLVIYKQDEPQNSMNSIVPELATSWSWSEDGTELTFKLRPGIKWHDGKPFTAADVKCTYDLLLGQGEREASHQPAQSLVPQPRAGHRRQRGRGEFSPAAAAAGVHHSARLRLFADLSLPRVAARNAHCTRSAPGRSNLSCSSRTSTSGSSESGLLEAGPALSRRHRVHDHSEPLDRDTRVCRRQARHDLAL